MCKARDCYRAEDCKRHEASGTVPGERQAWGDFSSIRYWDADDCSGFWPVKQDPGVYGGKGLV